MIEGDEICDACSEQADQFIGGAYFCTPCVEYYDSLPVPTVADMEAMEAERV